jgi:ubiquinone/menaquinone biosynthesis C-methylase UbiE
MLARARRRIEAAGLQAQFVCGDVMAYSPDKPFDAVAVNFFLNVFAEPQVTKLIHVFRGMLKKPGGRIMIADFSIPRPHGIARPVQIAYWRIVDWFYWAFGMMSLHPFYDYESILKAAGFRIEASKVFPVLPGCRAPSFSTWIADCEG